MTEAVRFKIDENLPGDVVDLLRSGGFDARHVLDQGMGESTTFRWLWHVSRSAGPSSLWISTSQTFASTHQQITLASSC